MEIKEIAVKANRCVFAIGKRRKISGNRQKVLTNNTEYYIINYRTEHVAINDVFCELLSLRRPLSF